MHAVILSGVESPAILRGSSASGEFLGPFDFAQGRPLLRMTSVGLALPILKS